MLDQIRDTLKGEQERLAKDGLVRLTTNDNLTVQTGNYQQAPNAMKSLGFATKAAIAIVIIAALAGVATFVMYVHLERKKKQQKSRPYIGRDKKNSSCRTLGCEDSSQVSETIGLRDGTAVVLEGGRPVVIEFESDLQRSRGSDSVSKAQSITSRSHATPTSRSHTSPTSPTRSRVTVTTRSQISPMARPSIGSISPNYKPRSIRRPPPIEETKNEEPEAIPVELQQEMMPTAKALPVEPMAQSVASESQYAASEFTEETCSATDRGEYT